VLREGESPKIFLSMGKIYKNFYPQIYDLFNLWQAFGKASKGRRGHPSIAAFEYNLKCETVPQG
jgi:hypothetical protein